MCIGAAPNFNLGRIVMKSKVSRAVGQCALLRRTRTFESKHSACSFGCAATEPNRVVQPPPPRAIDVVSGGLVGGIAITVRNKEIKLKFCCDILSSPAM
jgi:hypothetical protein